MYGHLAFSVFPEQGFICRFLAPPTVHFVPSRDGGSGTERGSVSQGPSPCPSGLLTLPRTPLLRLFPQHGSAFPSVLCRMIPCRSVRIPSKINLVGELVFKPSPLRRPSPLLWGPQLFVSLLASLCNPPSSFASWGWVHSLTVLSVSIDRSIITTGL